MLQNFWEIRWLWNCLGSRRRRPAAGRPSRRPPALEALEDRALPSFLPAVNYTVGPQAAPLAVATADLRGTGILDLVTANVNTHTVSVLLGDGDGTFQAPAQYPSGAISSNLLALGDVNGDGIRDIVLTASDTTVLLGNGDGTFQAPVVSQTRFPGLVDAELADVNGDGIPDLLGAGSVGAQPTLSIALGNGDGTFRNAYSYIAPGFLADSLAVGDVNGDGLADAASASAETICDSEGNCETTGAVTLFLATGGGFFGPPTVVNPVPGAGSIVVGDFNGDGIPDLLTVNTTIQHDDSLGVLFGNGDGTFQRPVYTPRPPGALGPAVAADFNGDGVLDVAAASWSANRVRVFLGNGDGTFQGPQSFAVDQEPISLATGDFNGDGFPDLATANLGSASRNVSVLINAADWSSPAGTAVLRLPADPSADNTESSRPTRSLPSPFPSGTPVATEDVLAAATSATTGSGLSPSRRGVRDGAHGGMDLIVSPDDLPWDSRSWPVA